MNEKPFLEKYSGQSTHALLALEGQYRVDSIVLAFEEALDYKAEKNLDRLTPAEQVVLAVVALEREINNGGYAQFFINSSSKYVSIVVEALRQIGCESIAELTDRAISCLKIDGPLTEETIECSISQEDDDRDDQLDECDAIYYEKAGDLSALVLDFIKANQSEISIP